MMATTANGVIKLKPIHTPRTLEGRTEQRAERAKKSVQSAKSAVIRSRELVKRSQEVMDAIRERKKRV